MRRRESTPSCSVTNMADIDDADLPDVGVKIVDKADFASVDLRGCGGGAGNSGGVNGGGGALERLGGKDDDAMKPLVVAFTDMLETIDGFVLCRYRHCIVNMWYYVAVQKVSLCLCLSLAN